MARGTKAALAVLALVVLGGCAQLKSRLGWDEPWMTLIEGERGLENFIRLGDADWSAADGAIQATRGSNQAFLVSRNTWRDFAIRAEFWASDDANSGIFLRCQDAMRITDENCYEANIFDQRPDPTYGTGAIVKVAPVSPMPKAGGRWNTYEITAQGDRLVLVLNGVKTVDVRDRKFAGGPIALQWARGTVKWRRLQVRRL